MANELTHPAQLRCAVVDVQPGISSPNMFYVVTDENNIVVAQGVSSSPEFVRHDAGGYHTKKRFDEMFPQGWNINFDC